MRQRVWLRASSVSVLLAAIGCSGSDGSDGLSAVTAIEEIVPGSECRSGGIRFKSGLDENRNRQLDEPAELQSESSHCYASGTALRAQTETAGEHCSEGGFAIYEGADELLGYVCNGAGTPGAPGADGRDLSASIEPAGQHCAKGGIAVSSSSGGVIGYVCNGEDADSAQSSALLIETTSVPSGSSSDCAYGGRRLAWGNDSGDRDGSLQAEEVLGSMLACDAAPAICSTEYRARSQADVDALAGCLHQITGSVTLDSSEITTLSALSGLQKIVGSLTLAKTGLSSLAGLEQLERIGGDLRIEGGNTQLTSFSGLGALTAVGGVLSIGDLAGPSDFTELASITALGSLYTHDDGAIESYDGLQNLTQLRLDNFGKSIASLTGLDNLVALEGSDFRFGGAGNVRVSDLAPLTKLKTLGSLVVQNNAAIDSADLSALSGVETLGDVYIQATGQVNDLSALTPTQLTGSFELVGNGVISGLDTFFASITAVPGNLRIAQQPLGSLAFLSNLTAIGGTLTLQNNPNLTSFAGLESLTSLGANLTNADATALNIYNGPNTLCGLVSLTTVRGSVYDNDGSFSDWQTKLAIPQPSCP